MSINGYVASVWCEATGQKVTGQKATRNVTPGQKATVIDVDSV